MTRTKQVERSTIDLRTILGTTSTDAGVARATMTMTHESMSTIINNLNNTYANHRGDTMRMNHEAPLLDVLALAALDLAVGNPGCATRVAPLSVAASNTNDLLAIGEILSVTTMNGDEVTGEVVLAAEGPAARFVMTSIGL